MRHVGPNPSGRMAARGETFNGRVNAKLVYWVILDVLAMSTSRLLVPVGDRIADMLAGPSRANSVHPLDLALSSRRAS